MLLNGLRKFIRSIFHIKIDTVVASEDESQHKTSSPFFACFCARQSTSADSSFIKADQKIQVDEKISFMMDALEDALSCPVCLDEFRKVPKILPTCGHSFCLPCIEHWYEFSGALGTGLIRCPVCKCKTNLRLLQCARGRGGLRKRTVFRDTPPPTSSLRKLLHDSPTVGALLKLQKRVANKSGSASSVISTNKNVLSSLQTLLTCKACHFRLEDPRMLPACRHSFCTSCLQKLYKPPSTTTTNAECNDSATIVCPVCQILYRFNFRSSTPPCSPAISTSKSALTEKQNINTHKPPPPKEKLATYLPFDYVLGCLLDAIPEKL